MRVSIDIFHHGVFNPGAVIEGNVIVLLKSSRNIRGIYLKVRGQEHTSWKKHETRTDTDNQMKWETVPYSGENKFLQYQQKVHGEGKIAKGVHHFPFRFTLPINIPSTYEDANGHIQYYLKANVDMRFASDCKEEKRFTVFSPINLNIFNAIKLNPTHYHIEDTNRWYCRARGLVTMEVFMNREAFALGETMKLKIHITNLSSSSVVGLELKLIRITEKKCKSPRSDKKQETEVLAQNVCSGVGAHGDRLYNIQLNIPVNMVLPNFIMCKLFSQWCILKIKATVTGWHSNLKMETGIVLGHIPPISQNNTGGNQLLPPSYSSSSANHVPEVRNSNSTQAANPPHSSGRIQSYPPSYLRTNNISEVRNSNSLQDTNPHHPSATYPSVSFRNHDTESIPPSYEDAVGLSKI